MSERMERLKKWINSTRCHSARMWTGRDDHNWDEILAILSESDQPTEGEYRVVEGDGNNYTSIEGPGGGSCWIAHDPDSHEDAYAICTALNSQSRRIKELVKLKDYFSLLANGGWCNSCWAWVGTDEDGSCLRCDNQTDGPEDMANEVKGVQALTAEITDLKEKLNKNRCNSGHTTLPVYLWDCPECVKEKESSLTAKIKELEGELDIKILENCKGSSVLTDYKKEVKSFTANLKTANDRIKELEELCESVLDKWLSEIDRRLFVAGERAELKKRVEELEGAEGAAIEPMQDSIDFLTAENERLKEALEFYADEDHTTVDGVYGEWQGNPEDGKEWYADEGDRARQALSPDHIVDANKKVETTIEGSE